MSFEIKNSLVKNDNYNIYKLCSLYESKKTFENVSGNNDVTPGKNISFVTGNNHYLGTGPYEGFSKYITNMNDNCWTYIQPGPNRICTAIHYDNIRNFLYIGCGNIIGTLGENNLPIKNIAKFDFNTSTWSTLGTGFNNTCNSLAVDINGNLYAAGAFTTAGGVTVNYIAKWDGNVWTSLGTGLNGTCNTISFDKFGNLYAGGSFTTAGGVTVNRIAKWDGNNWSSLPNGGLNNTVNKLCFDNNNNLYVIGSFTSTSDTTISLGRVAKWDGISWNSLGGGFNGSGDSIISDNNNNIYAGGTNITATVGGTVLYGIAKWDGNNWIALSVSNVSVSINGFCVDNNNNLYVGGSFIYLNGIKMNRIAKWDGIEWKPLGEGFDNTVSVIINVGNELYIGGAFTKLTDQIYGKYLVKYNPNNENKIMGDFILNGKNINNIVYTNIGKTNLYIWKNNKWLIS